MVNNVEELLLHHLALVYLNHEQVHICNGAPKLQGFTFGQHHEKAVDARQDAVKTLNSLHEFIRHSVSAQFAGCSLNDKHWPHDSVLQVPLAEADRLPVRSAQDYYAYVQNQRKRFGKFLNDLRIQALLARHEDQRPLKYRLLYHIRPGMVPNGVIPPSPVQLWKPDPRAAQRRRE